ncbi:MAG TPA: hypothetical protein VG367_05615 [Mucilaginibacter sp.]|jgi:hypothetical protein|nr:hypothetical protein [Mucilaginibacter sp.]
MTAYLDDTDGIRDDDQLAGKPNPGSSSGKQKKGSLETKGPAKEKAKKVLHKDGSFGKLPGKEGKGSGALEGVVGLGT